MFWCQLMYFCKAEYSTWGGTLFWIPLWTNWATTICGHWKRNGIPLKKKSSSRFGHYLKSVHFKNTGTRSSFHSKVWPLSIIHQLTSKQSQLMLHWKWPQFWKKWSCNCVLKHSAIFGRFWNQACKDSIEILRNI